PGCIHFFFVSVLTMHPPVASALVMAGARPVAGEQFRRTVERSSAPLVECVSQAPVVARRAARAMARASPESPPVEPAQPVLRSLASSRRPALLSAQAAPPGVDPD